MTMIQNTKRLRQGSWTNLQRLQNRAARIITEFHNNIRS